MVVPCNNDKCQQKNFAYAGLHQCPFCGTPSYAYPVGTFYSPEGLGEAKTYKPDGSSITVVHNRQLHEWHTNKIGFENMAGPENTRLVKGRFIRAQIGWSFENKGFDALVIRNSKKPVPIGTVIEVENDMQLQLKTDGRILLIRIP
jgi:hypothetical protein